MPVKVLLKEMRIKRGLSQNELARKIEMSLNAVQHIEYKAKAIQLDTVNLETYLFIRLMTMKGRNLLLNKRISRN